MKTERDEDRALEGFLKAALADDLPADVEAGMRERIRRFRADPSEGGRSSTAWAWTIAAGRLGRPFDPHARRGNTPPGNQVLEPTGRQDLVDQSRVREPRNAKEIVP